MSEWIPVTDRLPEPGRKVLVAYLNELQRTRVTTAHHAPKHTLDASHWEDGETEDTEDGSSWEPEGWWEEGVELETLQFIHCEVTHWMPMPAHPDRSKP